MSQPTAPSIPAFYRIFFTYLDPIICAWGATMDFFMPTVVLSSHIPSPTPDIGHAMILKQRGGGMLNFGIMSAVLLRYTNDMNVWRIVQLSCFVVDLAYYWAVWEVLAKQGRLSLLTEISRAVDCFHGISALVLTEFDDCVHDVQNADHEFFNKLVESRFEGDAVVQLLQMF
ncbi:hypothetical protein J4E85_005261 [Alternaria conjuncta]|uniref:uncharacterized protein n=1 Tax=Alternaria conjuncta TaxID=181017 RepID=UPI00221FCE57|nr:uncharacterized protein J4E85_005261 [Alternaria conjuncta]KAI4928643.1 hypothetical protein J4E85_005261 [Alternaria conjuncta]